MNRMSPLTQVRAFTGVLTLVAIEAQLKTTFDAGVLNPVNFFNYFTIHTVVAVLVAGAVLCAVYVWLGNRRGGSRSRIAPA